MRALSKTKLLAFRQCPRRLWLEIHRPELREDSPSTLASFSAGHRVGEIARRLYDPEGKGQLIDAQREGFDGALARSAALLASTYPIFEAGFTAVGVLAFADVLLPVGKGQKKGWRMVEVKSSTSVKDYHLDDTAIQAMVARKSGVPLTAVALAHIDSKWVYPGAEDYAGLLMERDLTAQAFGRESEAMGWIADAKAIAALRSEPKTSTGQHCGEPYACGFLDHCQSNEPQAKYPINWLPDVRTKALKTLIESGDVKDLRDVPDELLNGPQRRVKDHTISRKVYFDGSGAAKDLADHKPPAYFIDFETIQFPIPIWKGTRPYQFIPFQFSVHRLSRTGKLEHLSFLDLSGDDPSRAFAESLIAACGERGPVFVYNASFEATRIKELGARFPGLKTSLLSINDRIVDLLGVAKRCYYHPSQCGSWSIKKVLPAVFPDLRYDTLEGVQDGGMAMNAFLEAIAPTTTANRKAQIEQQLVAYCGLDTYAMVRLWQYFSGRNDFTL